MLGSVYAKSLRDRWTTPLLAGLGMGVLLLFAMAIYSEIDVSFYYELPAPMLEAMGISAEVGGVGGIAYGAIFNLMGAMAVAGVGISLGAAAIAGEELDGTFGLLLGNPKSRSQVLASKLAAMVTLLALAGALLWAGAVLVPEILSVDITGIDVFALVLHLIANSLFWGMLALAIGAWTGNRAAAVGGAAGLMILSWLANSFLPLVESVADIAMVFPWYYFSSSQPEINGINWAHLGVLGGLSAICGVFAFVGLRRRDLKKGAGGTSIVDRLRENPRTQSIMDKVAGSARVSSVAVKAASDRQGLLVVIIAVMFYMGLLLIPFFNLLPDSVSQTFGDLPDALLAAIGGADMSTPTGWIKGEMMATVFPIAAITLFASFGARAVAGEEDDHTMGLLLANPISRTRILLDKVKAMLLYGVILALATWVGSSAGVLLGGLDVSILNLLAMIVLGTLMALVFGAVALAISAATGKVKVAVYSAAALGLVGYFMESFFPLAESFEGFAVLSPFHYFLGSDPLVEGMAWGDAGILAAAFVILVALSVPLFNRRDLRG